MMTPMERRAARKASSDTGLDMNLTALIDVFTILIFFLLSSAGVESTLPSSKAVTLPASTAEKMPRETLAVVVSAQDIVVEGRIVASVPDVMQQPADLIPALQAELTLLAQRQTVRKENADAEKALTIVADKNIPYKLLRKVMATGAAAGFSDVSFALQQKPDL